MNGEIRPLEPKSFRLLQFLIENRHRVVPKDEILTVVWEGVAVSDNALTRAVAQVRKALDDDPKQPQFIETVPTVGYRFLVAPDVEAAPQPAAPSAALPPPARTGHFGRLSAALVLAVGVAGLLYFGLRPSGSHGVAKPILLTSYPGEEWNPTFSPDGSQVAFSWNGEREDESFDVYVKAMGSELPLRLTTDPGDDLYPAWSPDGRRICFVRLLPAGRFAIILISALGGAERKLVELTSRRNQRFSQKIPLATSWSPDGKWLAVSADPNSVGFDRLLLVSTESGEVRQLSRPPSPDIEDNFPSFSVDGHSILFQRQRPLTPSRLYRVALDAAYAPSGEPTEIPVGELDPMQPLEIAGGKEVLFASNEGYRFGPLFRVPADGSGVPVKVEGTSNVGSFGVSRDGRKVAYSFVSSDTNIWRLDLEAFRREGKAQPQRFIASTQRDVFPQYSPDGKYIAFYSNRSGNFEIWRCDADGGRPVALTSVDRRVTGTPRWSPDGRTITFDSNFSGNYAVYSVGAEGGKIRQLTDFAGGSFGSGWSPDGQWLYYSLNGPTGPDVWKLPAQGGASVRVTTAGGLVPVLSSDGKMVYYIKSGERSSLWRRPVEGGSEEKLVDGLHRFNFAVTEKGVFVTRDRAIDFLDFATGGLRRVLNTKQPDTGLAVSPDGRYLLFAQIDSSAADLMLIENFR